eukprot:TRINITY_DN31379_c0_g1_i1.p1 TRINITY_DN31379_c0_g1~~TRINITY_DN31379_c0_g1_i1.p1  ORF type:complete len:157 (+),score=22.67 TRINITY_DN31379_c0_g1_i1:63-533(+)
MQTHGYRHVEWCAGAILEVLQREFGKSGHLPGLVLHSYCGSPEMVAAFVKLHCYFSFSASILRFPKHAAALRAAPRDRLLLETDSPDQLPQLPDNGLVCGICAAVPQVRNDDEGALNEPAFLPAILAGAAAALDISAEEVAAVVTENARRVFLFES